MTPRNPLRDQSNAYVATRNLVTGAFLKQGYANIAHARRCYGRDDQRILALYGYTRKPGIGNIGSHNPNMPRPWILAHNVKSALVFFGT